MNKKELLEKCKELGITKCSSKNKSQLIEFIQKTKPTVNEENVTSTLMDSHKYTFISIHGSMNSQYKQIGNAVPVELAKKWENR
jgi:hypothetical protein